MPDLVKAQELLVKATNACPPAKVIADKYARYATEKKYCDDTLAALKLHKQTAAIADEQVEIEKQITAAAELAKNKNYDGAIVKLAETRKACAAAQCKADMQATLKSPAPDAGFLKVLMEESGGTDVLDAIIKKEGDTANRAFLMAAVEVRFGLTSPMSQVLSEKGARGGGATDKSAPDKSIKKIYDLLLKVPASHAKDNPKVAKIERYQEDTGGAAYGGGGIYLNCGRAEAGGSNDYQKELCDPKYFPEGVDPDCQPANDDEAPYFDWATLHEVGHAVDDNVKFMNKNGGDKDCGNWEDHGTNIDSIAAAAHAEFGYDLNYIKEVLKYNTPGPVTLPGTGGKTQKQWDEEKAKVDKWFKLVGEEGLWWNGSGSIEAAIKGRVYQIAYKDRNKWVSYDLAARKQGLHGYQFRAPGEWFAELYAAYYLGKLKGSHPAVQWLEAL